MGDRNPGDGEIRIVRLEDEREPIAEDAFVLIRASFPPDERHQTGDLRLSLETSRRGLAVDATFQAFAAVDSEGAVSGAATGTYLHAMNFGFVGYLVVREGHRGSGLGRRLRDALVEGFRDAARQTGEPDLAWVVGEVGPDNPWLSVLTTERGARVFPVPYEQPALGDDRNPVRLILYREPVSDFREPLPDLEVARVVYLIYRRIYAVTQPLRRAGFRAMIDALDESSESEPQSAGAAT